MVTRRTDQGFDPAQTVDVPLLPATPRSDPRAPGLSGYQSGLAGLGLLTLVAYSLGLPIPGGGLGADILLVVTGFQLTRGAAQAARRAEQGTGPTSRWRLRFLFRALGPIMAPMLVAAAVTAAVVWWDGSLGDRQIEAAVGAASGFANLFTVYGSGELHALDHFWLVALMAQFALLAPWVARLGGKSTGNNARAWVLLMAALAMAATRFGLLFTDSAPSLHLAVHSVTRFDGLLLGAAVALAPRRSAESLGRPAIAIATALVVAGLFAAPDLAVDPIGGLGLAGPAVAMAAAILLYAPVARTRVRVISTLLTSLPLRWLGQRAISIYVWHRLMGLVLETDHDAGFFAQQLPEPGLLALQVLFALALGASSYRYLQLPLSQAADALLGHRRSSMIGPRPTLSIEQLAPATS